MAVRLSKEDIRSSIHRPGTASEPPVCQEPLRVLSVCSGISAESVAWCDLPFEFVGYCEIDAFPCHVLAHQFGASRPRYLPVDTPREPFLPIPEHGRVPNFGDFTQLTDADLAMLGRVDLLVGGTPCQSFSSAGLRNGLADPRGGLSMEFMKLAKRMQRINGLKFVIWENVHGVLTQKVNVFDHLVAVLVGASGSPLQPTGRKWTNAGHIAGPTGAVAWRVLDAQFFRGTPQRRRRVWMLAALGDPGDRLLKPEAVLFERNSVHGDP